MGNRKDRLEQAEASFRASADEVNTLLQVAERRAAALSPGYLVTSKFNQRTTGDFAEPCFDAVGVLKVKGQWRLVMATCIFDEFETVDWTPVLECSIDERIEAAQNLEPLFDKLVQVRIEQTKGVQQAALKLRQVLRSLGDEEVRGDASAEAVPF